MNCILVSVRKPDSRRNISKSQKTVKTRRNVTSPKKIRFVDKNIDTIMLDVLKVNDNEDNLKKLFFEIDTDLYNLKLQKIETKEAVEKIVDSAYEKHTTKNPLTAGERITLIRIMLIEENIDPC